MNVYMLLNLVTNMVPGQIAVSFEGRHYSYEQMAERVGRLAAALEQDGVAQGDRIGIISTNSPEVLEAFFAAFQIGAGAVPINYRAKPDELSFMLADSGIKVLIVEERYVFAVQSFLEEYPNIKVIVIGDELEKYMQTVDSQKYDFADVTEDDLALLLYTSGTTSNPKGVVMTHGQLTNYVMGRTEPADGTDNGAYLTCVPNYHVAGATSLLNSLYGGRRIVLTRQFSEESWIDIVERERVTHAFLVPTMLKRIIDHPGFAQSDFSSLQSLSYGSAPMPYPVIRKAIEVFPDTVGFANAFGMTETTSTVSVLGPEDHRLEGSEEEIQKKLQRLNSVGKVVDGVEIKILNDFGETVQRGEVGNVYIKTARAMKSYWNRPEASKETVVDGWINTKDLGWMDEEDYLFLVGRNSDMIIRGGENISPQEVENILLEHEGVKDAAVLGVPNMEWGEEVLAVIVPRDLENPPAVDSLTAHCKKSLASFKCPKIFEFAADLPRTSSGKILKRDLKEQFASEEINS
ncbi:MAG: class I adenylate-forming enzyme family protein [Lysinibacillus sp.]